MKRKAYRATDVKDVEWEPLLAVRPHGPVWVGVDVGKFEMYVVLRWSDGTFDRPWRAFNPGQLALLVAQLQEVAKSRPLNVAMESTGTYGDPLRAQLAQCGLPVQRIGSKAASDYAESFDGVPSQHDGKDAAVLAELAAFGKGRPWPYREPSEVDADLRYWVDWLDAQQNIQRL